MPAWFTTLIKGAKILAIVIGAAALGLTGYWLQLERGWDEFEDLGPREAFIHGTLGLEFAPLKYALVMDEVSGHMFNPGMGDRYPGWIDAYGFILPEQPDDEPLCLDTPNLKDRLPVGITVSNILPLSAQPQPVEFAGLSCAACHASQLDRTDGPALPILYGVGSERMDLIAWTDAFKNAVSDPTLSAEKILDAYEAKCGPSDQGFIDAMLEKAIVGAWLSQFQDVTWTGAMSYDLPFAGAELFDPEAIAPGPSRTRPFRSVVRTALLLPGAENNAISKVPVVFSQNHEMRPASQYDGSIRDAVTRSLIAAYTSGSSVYALNTRQIDHNVRSAAAYSLHLGETTNDLPHENFTDYAYQTLFPDAPIDLEKARRGQDVYLQNCASCHGYRPIGEDGSPGTWVIEGFDQVHEILNVDPDRGPIEIGTDPSRILFRYAEMLPVGIQMQFPLAPGFPRDEQLQEIKTMKQQAIEGQRGTEAYFWQLSEGGFDQARRTYPSGHKMAFPLETLADTGGYINNPIPHAWLRAPYIHNASIPTMRQLINLDPRPALFCRGRNPYDPSALGLADWQPGTDGSCPEGVHFLYDITAPGNSNAGHDYPWAYDDPARDPAQLEDLLEYLKLI